MAKLLSSIALLLLATQAFGTFDPKSWIQMHSTTSRQPDMSELAELQNSNPEAYALVKALLVKQSLGLIRKKEPEADAGSEYADTSSSSGGGDSAPTHSSKSFWGWKPPDDSAAVSSVLGQVAGSLSAIKSKPGRTMDPDDAEPVRAAEPVQEAPVSVSSPEQEPDPLTMKDGPMDTPVESTRAADTGSSADIFSKGASEAKNEAKAADKVTDAGGPPASGSFWSGLFGSKPKPEPAAKSKPAPKKMAAVDQGSSYLKNFDWNSDDGSDDQSTDSKSSSGSLSSSNSYAHFLN